MWSREQSQKDSKLVCGIQPTVVKSQGKTSQWKISEDDDDASDSEKMVICEDEATGNERHC